MTQFTILQVRTEYWECSIRTRQQDPAEILENLRKVVGADKDLQAEYRCSANAQWVITGQEPEPDPQGLVRTAPCLFENRTYSLRFAPLGGAMIRVQHPVLQDFNEGLDEDGGIIRSTWKTGNDIGWFSLVICYTVGGKRCEDRVAWQVWPSKLDYGSDFQALVREVSKTYPLWLFRFAAPTEHSAGRTRIPEERFWLLWLKSFETLFGQLQKGVRTILRSPHQRLATEVRSLRAQSLRGPISARLEEALAEGRSEPQRRYRQERMRASLDTPENRFIKHALERCLHGLEALQRVLEAPTVSQHFQETFQGWKRFLQSSLVQPLFRGIGEYEGNTQESLVLHHRAGYNPVYRAWLELRHYLEFFAAQPRMQIGMRQISELYEIWCFLEIRRLLLDMDFVEDEESFRHPRIQASELEAKLQDGMGAAFRFSHRLNPQMKLRLAHEPVFSKRKINENEGIRVFSVTQKPDIVLEATFPQTHGESRKGYWVFDAKYRLHSQDPKAEARYEDADSSAFDYLAPAEAIDQMHRYRDSLILLKSEQKSRPVVGAFALYPGAYDQRAAHGANPYASSIDEVGIGAFALLPSMNSDGSSSDSGCAWLRAYLRRILGASWMDNITHKSVVIPPSGLHLGMPGMVLLVPVPGDPRHPRTPEYMQRMRDGTQRWYHTYVDESYSMDIQTIATVRYIAPVLSDGQGGQCVTGIYECFSPHKRNRSDLDETMTGATKPGRDGGKPCWIFELRGWRRLDKPITVPSDWNADGLWFRYAEFYRLVESVDWEGVGASRQYRD